ncbi:molecular chaperone HtpG [Desulforamulus hydrothermalis]|uniref:Chaperone protein HtpG n=1 Tax=Desulforamulus hydrothermalis Lam5 = DSM 18033 TaxID=1121428 RepID=K8E753_9FIRM|nr:molecular chaperone HtpG [Desulforamulus hydrothermalis]CCO07308.1 Chaperone protein htpG [Desulforamulus hydrothermalis Lam5 = DSM 18033]SHG93718.1 molecular chaperone HtpG [Desulforamulus hydrothermalis Lam5 = DSM 18033]
MTGPANHEKYEFQAEVKQLLDIVINSLYTDREIFLRELISNAADALEKIRYQKLTSQEIADADLPLEIAIQLDENNHTLTISDTGIGMTREELITNLGTIAHSGSRNFLKYVAAGEGRDVNLIGRFGVGFYAAFMVAEQVTVATRSYLPQAAGWQWSSDGAGSYTIAEATGLRRGTSITLHLKEDAREFAREAVVKRIIKQYSGFVPFPVLLNGTRVNTVQAIWTKNKNEITDEEYTEFYKYLANAYDEPLLRLHFSADAPLNINALLFVPKDNFERFGFGRLEPGVNLYCRKVLIQQQAKDILPEWLRFVKGVVDSEELPLNISRETMQDSSLLAKLRKVITSRFLKFLQEQAKSEPAKYKEFWNNFGMFIKEGAATDYTYRKELVGLLRFASSRAADGEQVSLQDYAARMKEGQKEIYFINGPSREVIEASPYLEVFRDQDIEVLFTHEPVEDYILSQLGEYEGKKLVSIDQAGLALPATPKPEGDVLNPEQVKELIEWLKEVLGEKVTEVRESTRLTGSPAIILNPDHLTGSLQRMMQVMNRDINAIGPKVLEINTAHPVIKGLSRLAGQKDSFARLAAEQLFDNALIAAGLIVDPRAMVQRMNQILEKALQ